MRQVIDYWISINVSLFNTGPVYSLLRELETPWIIEVSAVSDQVSKNSWDDGRELMFHAEYFQLNSTWENINQIERELQNIELQVRHCQALSGSVRLLSNSTGVSAQCKTYREIIDCDSHNWSKSLRASKQKYEWNISVNRKTLIQTNWSVFFVYISFHLINLPWCFKR